MANERKYTHLNIGGTKFLRLPLYSTNPSVDLDAGQLIFDTSSLAVKYYDGSNWKTVSISGGGTGGDLDSAYSNGQSINIDQGAMALSDATAGSLDTFTLVKTGAGSGDVIDISIDAAITGKAIAIDMNLGIAANAIFIDNGATARTGSDLLITDDSTGAHSVIDINSSGSGATVGLDYTGSYNGSPAGQAIKVTLDANDALDTEIMQVTTGAGNRSVMFDLNLGHTDSGTTSHVFDIDVSAILGSNIFDFATSAACTGNVININLDTAVAMTGVHIEGSGVRTQPMLEIITDSTSSASLIDISVDGAITGQAAIDIDMNAGLAANAIYIDAGAGTRTANLVEIKDDGDGDVDAISIVAANTGSGSVVDLNVTGIRTGNVIDIALSAAATGDVIAVDMDAAVASAFLAIDAGAGTRTVDLIDVTFDGDGDVGLLDVNVTNTGSGNIMDFDISGIHTGNLLSITYSSAASTGDAIEVAMGTNVAGSALAITAAGARVDDLIKIDDSSTSNSALADINLTGAFTSVAIDINASGTHTAGIVKVTSNSANTGARNLVDIVNDNTAATGTIPLNIQQDAPTSTNYFKVAVLAGVTLWMGTGTTANGNLSGTAGDIIFNGGSNKPEYCTGTTSWTALA